MLDPTWMLKAKCSTQRMDPRLFDYDPDNPNDGPPAQLLCAGCPVQRECKEWHETPFDMDDYVERFTGRRMENGDVLFPSGVKAAGGNIGLR